MSSIYAIRRVIPKFCLIPSIALLLLLGEFMFANYHAANAVLFLTQHSRPSPSPPRPIQGISSLQPLWNSIFRNSPPPPPQPGVSRGGYFCPIAPYSRGEVIWSDRPTLVWQGPARQVELYEDGNSTSLFTYSVSDFDQVPELEGALTEGFDEPIYQVTYEGILEPGQEYEWKIVQPFITHTIPFRTLTAEQQAQVVNELNNLSSQLEAEGADENQIAIQKADYFAGQQLWSNFWQQILSIESPSDELESALNETISTFCPAPDIDSDPRESGGAVR